MLITERRMQQCIKDLMSGLDPLLDYDQLSPLYKKLWNQVDGYEPLDAYQVLTRVRQWDDTDPKTAKAIDAILSMEAGDRPIYRSMAEVGPELPEIGWLWPNWVPRGMLSVLAAPGGVGKTNVALDLCYRLTLGYPAPDGQPFDAATGNCIYVDAENFLPVAYKRIKTWGANLNRLFHLSPPDSEVFDLSNRLYQDQLNDMCYDLQPDLIVIDSLGNITLNGENNVEDMRGVLRYLTDLAGETRCGVVLIHHTRKPSRQGQSGLTMHDLRGSSHIVNMSRSVLGVYVASDDQNGPRRLVMLKTNLCKHPRPLLVHYTPTADPEIAGLTYNHAPELELPDNLVGECADWVLDILADGPMKYQDIVDAGAECEPPFFQNTIQRARTTLDWKVVDTKGSKVRGNEWALYGWNEETKNSHMQDMHPNNSHMQTENPLRTQESPHMQHMRMCDGGGVNFEGGGVTHAACVHVWNTNYPPGEEDRQLMRAWERMWQSEWELEWIGEWCTQRY